MDDSHSTEPSQLLAAIQKELQTSDLDGWLFFDHHLRDPLSYKILQLPSSAHVSRRWFYFIPREGMPRGIVHAIEAWRLDSLPGDKEKYTNWRDLHALLRQLLSSSKRVAMQYSPHCAIPLVSLVDAGTIDLVRSCGVTVVSSADLVQRFEATLTDSAIASHLEAGKRVDQIRQEAFALIREALAHNRPLTEFEVHRFILDRFQSHDLITNHGPDVAVNEHSSDPHYEPRPDRTSFIRRGDLVLIDMWAKLKAPGSIYYDITWCAFCGESVPDTIANVFAAVIGARDAAIEKVITACASHRPLRGYEVDDVARDFISAKGYGDYFTHRTGHSIGEHVHGNGANLDNLESKDERELIPRTCFSIEPGIYLPHFGIRSEINMLVLEGEAKVTGACQDSLVRLTS